MLKKIREDIREIEEVASSVKNGDFSKAEKKTLLEDLKRIMRKLKGKERNEVAVFNEDVFYGQVPTALLRDPTIQLQAKGLYAIMHSYSQPKSLIAYPMTFVSLDTLAKDAPLHKSNIGDWIKVLAKAGWIRVIPRKNRKSNWY
ncbi:unnamed protein product, partial [marine sediment metagenome]